MKEVINYELVKEYVGSPKLGTIHSYYGQLESTPNWMGTKYYDSHPQFWQRIYEVKKKYPMVDGNCVFTSVETSFKVGDKVIYVDETTYPKPFIIDKFFIKPNGAILCRSKDYNMVEDVMTVKIFKESFVTEDNIIVCEGDEVHWVIQNQGDDVWRYLYILPLCKLHKFMLENKPIFKIFSTKYAAEVFCLREKMLTSYKKWNEDVTNYQNKLNEGK